MSTAYDFTQPVTYKNYLQRAKAIGELRDAENAKTRARMAEIDARLAADTEARAQNLAAVYGYKVDGLSIEVFCANGLSSASIDEDRLTTFQRALEIAEEHAAAARKAVA